jgi:hypothetical protein
MDGICSLSRKQLGSESLSPGLCLSPCEEAWTAGAGRKLLCREAELHSEREELAGGCGVLGPAQASNPGVLRVQGFLYENMGILRAVRGALRQSQTKTGE